jgi:hypothetical protein
MAIFGVGGQPDAPLLSINAALQTLAGVDRMKPFFASMYGIDFDIRMVCIGAKAADHEAMTDAGLGGMKAALKLTPDQNPLWEAFENAVRGAGKARMDDMRQMMENRERMSSVERMDATAGHMARRPDELKKISEAAKPLYGSLRDTQKHKFELLGREMMMAASGPMWEELGDAGGTWVQGHWDNALQTRDPERGHGTHDVDGGYRGVPLPTCPLSNVRRPR